MRRLIIGFLLGTCLLQIQPSLPTAWQMLALLCCLLLGVALLARTRADRGPQMPPWRRLAFGGSLYFILLGGLAGFIWAAANAHWQMRHSLPKPLEGRDVLVRGVVSNLPARFDGGQRFEFTLEEILPIEPASASTIASPTASSTASSKLWPQAKGTVLSLAWYAIQDGPAPPMVQPGQRWQFQLRLQRAHGNANPYGFDYEVWLLEQGIRTTGYVRESKSASGEMRNGNQLLTTSVPGFKYSVERWRESLRQKIFTALPQQTYASVLVALVVGDQRAVAQSDWQLFNATGIGHLMSISGLHITMIAAMFASLGGFLWRHSFFTKAQLPLLLPSPKVQALAGSFAALVYVFLAGFGVPAQRTLYMLLALALATWTGRLSYMSHVLAFALLVVLLLDPWALLWPGFWLSFGAVALILYGHVGKRAQGANVAVNAGAHANEIASSADTETALRAPTQPSGAPEQGSMGEISLRIARLLGVKLVAAAQLQMLISIGLVPLSLLLFAQISLISPLANAFAIPLISFVVTPLALLGAVLPQPLDGLVLQLAHQLLEILVAYLQWLNASGLASWRTPQPDWWQFAFAMLGILLFFAPRGWPGRAWAVLFCLPMLLQRPSNPPAGQVWVTAFDVGQGTALLIETPQQRLLYDTGPAYSRQSDAGQRVLLPYLRARGIDHLDGLIISHADNDHSGAALTLLQEIKINWLASSIPFSHPIMQAAMQKQVKVMPCVAGQHWQWQAASFQMLHPSLASYAALDLKTNARSCTLKILVGQQSIQQSILLTGDIEAPQERALIASDAQALRADVLLVPHHGSGTSSTPAFLQAVQPRIAIFQLGYRNRYHHPKESVWQRYQQLGIQRWRSDQAGAISLVFQTNANIEKGIEKKAAIEITGYRQTHQRYWYFHD